jgi:hypothetical protein
MRVRDSLGRERPNFNSRADLSAYKTTKEIESVRASPPTHHQNLCGQSLIPGSISIASNNFCGGLMRPDANSFNDTYRAYRRRLVARGRHQFIADLPRETVAFLDELKKNAGACGIAARCWSH